MKNVLFIGGVFHGQRHDTHGREVCTVTQARRWKDGIYLQFVYTLQKWREGNCITEIYVEDDLSREEADTLMRGYLNGN